MGASPVRIGLLVAVLATAGCAGLLGADSGELERELTPAPVPTPEPAPAPGVEGDRVVAPDRLVAANERLLNGTSHRFERTVTVTGPEGTVRVRRVQRVRTDGAALGRLRVTGEGPVDSVVRNWTRWREGSIIWSRTTMAAGRQFTSRLLASESDSFSVGREFPRRVLTGAQFRVVATSGGVTVVEPASTLSLDRDAVGVTTGQPRNVSARIVLTRRGLVQNLTVAYDARVGSTPARIRVVQTVSGLGTTTAQRPSWVPQAGRADGGDDDGGRQG